MMYNKLEIYSWKILKHLKRDKLGFTIVKQLANAMHTDKSGNGGTATSE